MDVYDFAEDYVQGGEPDFESFLTVSEAAETIFFLFRTDNPPVRFLIRPACRRNPNRFAESSGCHASFPRRWPNCAENFHRRLCTDAVETGNFKENNIHLAEFLRVSWAYEDEPEKVIDWVEKRRKSTDG